MVVGLYKCKFGDRIIFGKIEFIFAIRVWVVVIGMGIERKDILRYWGGGINIMLLRVVVLGRELGFVLGFL